MKTLIRILILALVASVFSCHAHSHKKKHHSAKKSKRSLLQDEVNYDEFSSGHSSPRRYKKTASQQEQQEEFDETFLRQFKKVIKVQFLWRKIDDSGETEVMGQKDLQLNQYGLFVHDVSDDSINGLIDMIRLDEMVTQQEVDDLKTNKPTLNTIIENVEMV